jgi:hypothetical protein
MDNINVKNIEIGELLRKNSNKVARIRCIKVIPVFLLICLLVFNLIYFPSFSGHTSSITIKVYAAEDEIQLTNDFISFNLNANQIDGGNDSSHCFINYNINFKCEGENIKTITYTCSDQNVNVNNRLSATAYFVENISVPADEYSMYIGDDNFIFGYKAEEVDVAVITKLIGNSYSVNYDNQNNKLYGLVLAGTVDNNGKYQLNNTIIKVDITLKDGSEQHKRIVINSNSIKEFGSEIQIRIL